MSDRRRFLKGLTSLPLATVLASPRLAAAVSAGLQEVRPSSPMGGSSWVPRPCRRASDFRAWSSVNNCTLARAVAFH